MEDNKSKFGTLVRVKDGIFLDGQGLEGNSIQMGRTLLSISHNKTFNFAKVLAQFHKENLKNFENKKLEQDDYE